MYYTVLYCTVLYCTVLYCTVLYCTVLYYTVREEPGVCTHGGQHFDTFFIVHHYHLYVVTMWCALGDGYHSLFWDSSSLASSLTSTYLYPHKSSFLIYISLFLRLIPLYYAPLPVRDSSELFQSFRLSILTVSAPILFLNTMLGGPCVNRSCVPDAEDAAAGQDI